MIYADWMILLLKLLLVPTFIGLVSLSSRRWGPIVGGWLIGLPLTSGPVAFFLALEQGDVFASEASTAIMMGIISVFAFALAYTWSATRFFWRLSLLASLCAYFACTVFLQSTKLPLLIDFVSVLGVLLITLLLMPHVTLEGVSLRTGWWEIPARMVSATALVFLITGVAQWLGPQLTGLLTPFPVYATILAVFTHRSEGGAHAIRLLRGVVAGSFTFAIFFLIISATITNWGVGLAFVSAILISALTHAVSFQLLRREGRG
ncbi:MAG: hypothetical protein WB661_12550 [Candidatus Bathyarchaeia archaeon]